MPSWVKRIYAADDRVTDPISPQFLRESLSRRGREMYLTLLSYCADEDQQQPTVRELRGKVIGWRNAFYMAAQEELIEKGLIRKIRVGRTKEIIVYHPDRPYSTSVVPPTDVTTTLDEVEYEHHTNGLVDDRVTEVRASGASGAPGDFRNTKTVLPASDSRLHKTFSDPLYYVKGSKKDLVQGSARFSTGTRLHWGSCASARRDRFQVMKNQETKEIGVKLDRSLATASPAPVGSLRAEGAPIRGNSETVAPAAKARAIREKVTAPASGHVGRQTNEAKKPKREPSNPYVRAFLSHFARHYAERFGKPYKTSPYRETRVVASLLRTQDYTTLRAAADYFFAKVEPGDTWMIGQYGHSLFSFAKVLPAILENGGTWLAQSIAAYERWEVE